MINLLFLILEDGTWGPGSLAPSETNRNALINNFKIKCSSFKKILNTCSPPFVFRKLNLLHILVAPLKVHNLRLPAWKLRFIQSLRWLCCGNIFSHMNGKKCSFHCSCRIAAVPAFMDTIGCVPCNSIATFCIHKNGRPRDATPTFFVVIGDYLASLLISSHHPQQCSFDMNFSKRQPSF